MNLPLTPEQEKAFKKLEAAYKACQKAGIYMVNSYGRLQCYDSALVDEYGDSNGMNKRAADVFPANDLYTLYSFRIPQEWCDDGHFIRLTKKGLQLKAKEEE